MMNIIISIHIIVLLYKIYEKNYKIALIVYPSPKILIAILIFIKKNKLES